MVLTSHRRTRTEISRLVLGRIISWRRLQNPFPNRCSLLLLPHCYSTKTLRSEAAVVLQSFDLRDGIIAQCSLDRWAYRSSVYGERALTIRQRQNRKGAMETNGSACS